MSNGNAPVLPRFKPGATVFQVFRQFLGYYVIALMTTAHLYFLLELLSPVGPPRALHVHMISWVLPVACALGATLIEYLARRKASDTLLDALAGQRHTWRSHLPFAVGVATFGFWAGSYFLVGALTANRTFHSMATRLDAEIPYVPQAVFIYLTVYPAALLPFLWENSLSRAFRTAGSMATVLLGSYVIMLLYPVALAHPPAEGPMLTKYALTLLHAADPSWNCFPSSHCAMILTAGLSLWHQGRIRGSYGIVLALAIGLSTLLTKQHYAADAVAGFLLAGLVHWIFFGTETARRVSEHMAERTHVFADRLSAALQ